MDRYTFVFNADENRQTVECGTIEAPSEVLSQQVTISVDPMGPWTEPLARFATFLSNIYGYSINDKLAVKRGDGYVSLKEAYEYD